MGSGNSKDRVRVMAIASLVTIVLTSVAAFTASDVRQDAAPPATASSSSSPASGSPRSVWDGVFTKAQAKRGEELYFAHCAACHGELLEGNGPATPLTGPGFAANWDGQSMGDMVERTRRTMPINKPGMLSRQQVADVLAYVLEVNKFPAGDVDLPRQAEVLHQIKFLATRP